MIIADLCIRQFRDTCQGLLKPTSKQGFRRAESIAVSKKTWDACDGNAGTSVVGRLCLGGESCSVEDSVIRTYQWDSAIDAFRMSGKMAGSPAIAPSFPSFMSGVLREISVTCFCTSYIVVLVLELLRLLGRIPGRALAVIGMMALGLFTHITFLWLRATDDGGSGLAGDLV